MNRPVATRRDFLEHLAQRRLRVAEGLPQREDAASGEPMLAEDVVPFGCRPAGEDPFDDVLEPVGVLRARLTTLERRVVGQLGSPYCGTERPPELIGDTGSEPAAVGGAVDPVRPRPTPTGAWLGTEVDAEIESLRDTVRMERYLDIEEGEVDMPWRPAAAYVAERGEHGDRPVQPSGKAADGMAPPNRRVVLASVAGNAHRAAERLQRHVIRRRMSPWASRAEAGHRARHEVGSALQQLLARHTEPRLHTGAVVVVHDVRLAEQLVVRLPIRVVLQVQRRSPLAAMHPPPESIGQHECIRWGIRIPRPDRDRSLDDEDVGAQVGQDLRRERLARF